tara:strand:- start:124 stop:924 length:801 start_codon:yes stop_codon:yes gene_type:complete
MKLGISYNIFDGEEMLPFALKNLRPFANFIVVVYQTKSNYGNDNPKLLPQLEKLKEAGLIDKLFLYEPNLIYNKDKSLNWKSGTMNEIEKREIGLKICRANNCDTYMTLDCDELYDPIEFKWSMNDFESNGYDTSYTKLLTYYKLPTMELRPLENWYQPLFYKIKADTKFEMQDNYPVVIDRTKMLNKAGYTRVYTREEIVQYHYAYVRHNLISKVHNSSAHSDIQSKKIVIDHYTNWDNIKDGAKLIGNFDFKLEEVENKFNIKL